MTVKVHTLALHRWPSFGMAVKFSYGSNIGQFFRKIWKCVRYETNNETIHFNFVRGCFSLPWKRFEKYWRRASKSVDISPVRLRRIRQVLPHESIPIHTKLGTLFLHSYQILRERTPIMTPGSSASEKKLQKVFTHRPMRARGSKADY